MPTLLRLDASLRLTDSHSRRLADRAEARWLDAHPGGDVIRRDLARDPPPHLDARALAGFDAGDPSRPSHSDLLLAELETADELLVACPLYNFGVPSPLKAWLDHVVRAGRSVRWDADGAHGLLGGRRAVLLTVAGGAGDDGHGALLARALGYIGLAPIERLDLSGTMAAGVELDAREAALVARLEALWPLPADARDEVTTSSDGMVDAGDEVTTGSDALSHARDELPTGSDALSHARDPASSVDDGSVHAGVPRPAASGPSWIGTFSADDRRAIDALRADQVRAILAGDAEAYARLCTADVRLLLSGRDLVVGRAAFLATETALLAGRPFAAMRQTPLRIEGDGRLAVEVGRQALAPSAARPAPAGFGARRKYCHVLRHTAEGWRFAVLMSNDGG